MTIKIDLPDTFSLTKASNNETLILPAISIYTNNKSDPEHLTNVFITVAGTPAELAKRIQSAYQSYSAFEVGRSLTNPYLVSKSDCLWKESLPEATLSLTVTVKYYSGETVGIIKPGVSSTQSQELVAKCKITTLITELPVSDYSGWFSIDFGTSNSTVTLYGKKTRSSFTTFPVEQEGYLSSRLQIWLKNQPTDKVSGVELKDWKSEWEKFLIDLMKSIQSFVPEFDSNKLGLQKSKDLLEILRQIEIQLRHRQPWFRSAAYRTLTRLFHQAFRVPPLSWAGMFPVELDKDRKETEIPSELEITHLDNGKQEGELDRIKVIMGEQARVNRSKTGAIKDRFFHSPKRYLGTNTTVAVKLNSDDQLTDISTADLLQAAYAHLINLANDYRYRNPQNFSTVGNIYRAVVTYPTVASPFVRHEIKQMVENLGIKDVRITFDEAVSVAIFFLWREFGGNLNVGLEAFKTRCHYDGSKWWQNVLVMDIGGGTTDLAVIRLTLEDVTSEAFDANADRGDGGRYYKITPKVLGSSGHLQLGGELISLRLFLLLKAAIADAVLTAIVNEQLSESDFKFRLDQLDEVLRSPEHGNYQSGRVVELIEQQNPSIPGYLQALSAADMVLPTRYKNDTDPTARRFQTFYYLWDMAERFKVKLAAADSIDLAIPVQTQDIRQLLEYQDVNLSQEQLQVLNVRLTVAQLNSISLPILNDAIDLARELAESSLARQEMENGVEQPERIDWLILSGKTCKLPQLKSLLQKRFGKIYNQPDYFIWNEERVTFEPDYSKRATSAGACYAEGLRQFRFAPKDVVAQLREGKYFLFIDVKNLFYFLPCSFVRELANNESSCIFEAGQQLYQLDKNSMIARRRSEWSACQLNNQIYRDDFRKNSQSNQSSQFQYRSGLWSSFNADRLRKDLQIEDEEFFIQNFRIQFEVDQELDFHALLCQGQPHRIIDTNLPFLRLDQAHEAMPISCAENGKVNVPWDITVNQNAFDVQHHTDDQSLIFDSHKDYTQELWIFRDQTGVLLEEKGLIMPLPPPPANQIYSFHVRDKETNDWQAIGVLSIPPSKSNYEFQHYVSLTDQGILRVHAFEVPYWIGETVDCLHQEGCVYRTKMQDEPNALIQEDLDPFSGIH